MGRIRFRRNKTRDLASREKELSKISHIAYSFTEDEEAFEIANKIGYKVGNLDIFYGDLNRKTFFIKDNSGIPIQLIKKKV